MVDVYIGLSTWPLHKANCNPLDRQSIHGLGDWPWSPVTIPATDRD